MQGLMHTALLALTMAGCTALSSGQGLEPATPLELATDPQVIQVSPHATLADRQCDAAGNIYLRTLARQGMSFSFASQVTRIGWDANAENIPLAGLAGSGTASHVVQFAVGRDGTLHEIVRARTSDDKDASTEIYYVSFEPNDTLRAVAPFDEEFVPSVLLPLPNGDFFAEGVTLTRTDNGVREKALVAIFGSDARLKRQLRQTEARSASSSVGQSKPHDDDKPFLPGATQQYWVATGTSTSSWGRS